MLYEKFVEANGKVIFDFIMAKNYTLRLIEDKNNNKKWDTGEFSKHIQPEPVHYYKGKLNIRANWDVEVSWSVE